MPAQRLALLVATYSYQYAGLRQLAAPGHDAEALLRYSTILRLSTSTSPF